MSVVTNFSKAAIARSQFNIPILVLRQVAEHSKFIKSNIDQDVIDLPFNQVPLAAEKKLRESWGVRSLLWYYDKFKPEVSQQCREIFHPPKEVQTRQLYAFTPEAPQKIDSYLKENHASDLQELKALDDQIAKSRWPQFTFAYRAYQIIQRFSEKLADHWEKLEAQLLSKPEDMDVKFIQGLQNKSQRTQLKIKEAIAQLKQNAGGNSNALLTRLAQDSLKKGQIDTIPLLKAAGADAEVIDKEAAKQGIHL